MVVVVVVIVAVMIVMVIVAVITAMAMIIVMAIMMAIMLMIIRTRLIQRKDAASRTLIKGGILAGCASAVTPERA